MSASLPFRSGDTGRFRRVYAACAALLLALPMVAMQLSGEVRWGPGDFVLAAGLLALLGLGIEGALRLGGASWRRAGVIALALAVSVIVWAELAVGIFD